LGILSQIKEQGEKIPYENVFYWGGIECGASLSKSVGSEVAEGRVYISEREGAGRLSPSRIVSSGKTAAKKGATLMDSRLNQWYWKIGRIIW
ncbi:MAG: hypothetical protein ACE5E2_07465, partial [Candidatus Binatia bacterium]